MSIHEITRNRKIESEYRKFEGYGMAKVVLRYDDECQNGHNSFGITVDSRSGNFGGCMHEELVKVFPEYAHLIKWHLCSSDEPMHYIANTMYWAKQGNLESARSCAIAPDATLEQLKDEEWLMARLPALMAEFRQVMEETFK